MKEIRTCIACRKKIQKSELFRIISKDNKAFLDNTKKANTRGIYICSECLKTPENIKKLSRISKIKLTENEIRKLIVELGETQIGKN